MRRFDKEIVSMPNKATREAIGLVGCEINATESPTAQALRLLAIVETFGEEQTLSLPSLGIEASEGPDGKIASVHLHSRGHEGFEAFPFEFNGVTFESDETEVRLRLGDPTAAGEGSDGPWSRYEFGNWYIHFAHSRQSGLLCLVTCAIP